MIDSMLQFWQEARRAARALLRTPVATLAAVLTLALTIGTTTAIFSVVEAVLLRPLPYPEADRLVRVRETSPQGTERNSVSSGNYLAWSERASSFTGLGAFHQASHSALTGDGQPERLTAAAMTPSVLEILRVAPMIGHALPPGTMAADQPAEVLLGAGFWRRRFAADPNVVGRTLTLDGSQYAVAGVMPAGFSFPEPNIDVWFARRFDAEDREQFRSHNFEVIGRLAPEVSIDAAQAEMTSLRATLTSEHPADLTGWGVRVIPAHADAVEGVRPLLILLMGVVALVLLIACANLATLQLARSRRRALEMAVRTALGAGRARLVRQLLTESLLVALAGGVLGALLQALALPSIVATAPADIPFLDTVRLDPHVLLFATSTTALCALLVGLAPALQISRVPVRPLLSGARTVSDRGQASLRLLLVAGQLGLTLVLLAGATLLVRSFWNLHRVDHGFDPRHLLTISLDLPISRYETEEAQVRLYDQLLERLRALPGVTGAAGTTSEPGSGAGMTFSFAIEGRPAHTPTGREDPVPLQGVTASYFETMGIPLIAGRAISATDGPNAPPVLVVNQALVRKHWPAGGAVGARIRFRDGQPWYRIVGVVGDTHDEGLDVPAPPTIYLPLAQRVPAWTWMSWQTLVVRTAGDPLAMVPAVRSATWSLDPDLPLLQVTTMESAFAVNDGRRRFVTGLVGTFAILALALGAIGVFGVLSSATADRRREIGIRLALGATPHRAAATMIRSTLTFALGGTAIGLAAALGLTRFLGSLLFEVRPTDPLAFLSVTLLLLAVASLAAWLPARRAVRLEPGDVLREG